MKSNIKASKTREEFILRKMAKIFGRVPEHLIHLEKQNAGFFSEVNAFLVCNVMSGKQQKLMEMA